MDDRQEVPMGSTDRRAANEVAIRRYCEAWKAGDLPVLVDCYHDDIVLHYFGESPLAGDHRGKAAALAALAKVQQLTNRRLVEIHDTLASDDHAVILARERFERDGRTLETNRVLLYHVRDGKLAECWIYDDDQRAVDAMWS
jgi:ketosteroid isomerase-like protein